MRSVLMLTVFGLAAGAASAQIAMATPLLAAGYNPGWTLSIDGTTATFNPGLHLQITPPKVVGAVQAQTFNPGVRNYEAQTGEGLLTARFAKQACTDAITAIVHPDTVQVRFAGTTYLGCGGDPLSLLQGQEWVVEDVASRGVIDRTRMTLQFDPKGTLSGRSSCNLYEGSYLFADGTLRLNVAPKPASTPSVNQAPPKICPPALRRQDAAFFEVLNIITRWDFTADGALTLGTVDGRRILARPQ